MNKEMTTLGDSCQFYNGKAHEKNIDAEGDYIVVNSRFISTDGRIKKYTGQQKFPLFENDILFVMSDVPNGKALAKCYIVEENDKYSLNQRICAIRTEEYDIRFLYYQLNRHPYLLSFNNGENQTNLRKGDILDCPLWKPSLKIQKQIVTLLDSAFAKIDQAKANIEKNIANAQELFQSKLNEIFSQQGDGWEEKSLAEICIKITDGAHHSPKVLYPEKAPGLFPYVTSKNIRNNYMDFSKLQYVDAEFHNPNFLRCAPELGDVLLTKDGANTGNITLNTLDEPFSLLSSVALIKTNKEMLRPSFLKYYIQSPLGFKNITGKMTGAAIKRIILRNIKSAKINIPSIELQKEYISNIEEILNNNEKVISIYTKKLRNLEDLKKSLLQKAFAGELTSTSSVSATTSTTSTSSVALGSVALGSTKKQDQLKLKLR